MHNSGNQIKPFDLDDFNLNSNPNEINWDVPQHNPQEIGNKIILAQETTPAPELGQVVDLEMPPTVSRVSVPNNEVDVSQAAASAIPSYDKAGLKTTDKLDERGVAAVNHVVSEFSRSGDAASFYNEVRGQGGMMETNLKQSYNRTLEDAA